MYMGLQVVLFCSIVVSNYRIVPLLYMGLQVLVVDELPMESHCVLQLKDPSRSRNGCAKVAFSRGCNGNTIFFFQLDFDNPIGVAA